MRRYAPARGRGYEVVDLARIQQAHSVVARRFVYLFRDRDGHARATDYFRSALRREKLEAQFVIVLCDVDYFGFVAVAHGHEYAAAPLHLVARRDKTFVQRFVQRLAYAQNFARGFHFRSEVSIEVGKFFKRENGDFDGDVWRGRIKSRAEAQFFELFADHALRRKFYHGHARNL